MARVKESNEIKTPVSRRAAIGLAFGTVVVRNQRLRRNALFGLTLLTLLLVFGGAVILGDGLMKKPVAFVIFWGICFLLVGLVLLLALYDLLAVRKEHRQRLRELDRKVAEAAELAKRELAKKTEEERLSGE
ncbi:MAG: hypothetical protein KDN20_25275 [Verrucomicrobiae bacterium]|nr:hypothetical protein [Verrucomicrobiae bacterium]